MTAKRLLLILLAVLLVSSASVAVFAATGAETRPLFNYFQPDAYVTYDKATGVYGLESDAQNKLNRLSAVDYEFNNLKPQYSDDLIRFSYRFTESHMTVFDPADWCLYFSFRNAQGELPPWGNPYAVYLMLKESEMSLSLYYGSSDVPVVETKVEYPTVTNGARKFTDNSFHTIEIAIDDATGRITVYRDKGTGNELSMFVDTKVDGELKLMDKGGYSFSTNLCKAELKELYFFNSKASALDDEIAKYEALIGGVEQPTEPVKPTEPKPTDPVTPPTEPVTHPTEPTEPEVTEPTEPEVTEPTEPEATEPTEPEATEPAETEPSKPADTEPEKPADTQPDKKDQESGDNGVLRGILIGGLIGGGALALIVVVGVLVLKKKK